MREEMRFEVILRMLIRIGIAQWLVVYNVDIMRAIFTSVGNLVGLIGGSEATQVTIDPAQADIIKNLGFVESLVFLILAVFLCLIILICGFFLIYNVYFRFLKILIVVPFRQYRICDRCRKSWSKCDKRSIYEILSFGCFEA